MMQLDGVRSKHADSSGFYFISHPLWLAEICFKSEFKNVIATTSSHWISACIIFLQKVKNLYLVNKTWKTVPYRRLVNIALIFYAAHTTLCGEAKPVNSYAKKRTIAEPMAVVMWPRGANLSTPNANGALGKTFQRTKHLTKCFSSLQMSCLRKAYTIGLLAELKTKSKFCRFITSHGICFEQWNV